MWLSSSTSPSKADKRQANWNRITTSTEAKSAAGNPARDQNWSRISTIAETKTATGNPSRDANWNRITSIAESNTAAGNPSRDANWSRISNIAQHKTEVGNPKRDANFERISRIAETREAPPVGAVNAQVNVGMYQQQGLPAYSQQQQHLPQQPPRVLPAQFNNGGW
ncbi:hypothetical protein HDU98_006894 [Podochytrium sp. JEL0797]|nr:hypothetical protein HDU98_006894 [Podochytrium sp. JEL0797]